MNQLDRNIIEDYCDPDRKLKVIDIYAKYGINQRDLMRIKKQYALKPRRACMNFTMKDKEDIVARYRNGEIAREIAKDLGVSKGSIHKILRELHVEHCYKASIEEKMKKAKELYDKGVSLKDIAEVIDMPYNNLSSNLYRYVEKNRYSDR